MTPTRTVDSLQIPLYHVLGRPVSPFLPFGPDEIECQVARLLEMTLERRRTGAPILASARWEYESALLLVISLTLVRLGHIGLSVRIRPFLHSQQPPDKEPVPDVNVVLGTHLYRRVEDWVRPGPRHITILSGCWDGGRWRDFRLPSPRPAATLAKLEPFRTPMRRAIESDIAELRLGIVATAVGCDLPRAFFASALPAPFVPIHDPVTGRTMPWVTAAGGQCVAWNVMARYTSGDRRVIEQYLETLLFRLEALGKEGRLAVEAFRLRSGTQFAYSGYR